jgi:hypothetical protein
MYFLPVMAHRRARYGDLARRNAQRLLRALLSRVRAGERAMADLDCSRWADRSGSAITDLLDRVAIAHRGPRVSISTSLRTGAVIDATLNDRAAVSRKGIKVDMGAASGLNMMAARLGPGANSESSSSHLPPCVRLARPAPSQRGAWSGSRRGEAIAGKAVTASDRSRPA